MAPTRLPPSPQPADHPSTLRDVPDSQTVFLSPCPHTPLTLIVDIVERAAPPAHPCATDPAALKYHYDDIASSEVDHSLLSKHRAEEVLMPKRERTVVLEEGRRVEGGWGMVGLQVAEEPRGSGDTEGLGDGRVDEGGEGTILALGMVRLEEVDADVLVCVSGAHGDGVKEEAVGMRDRVVRTLRVRDWGLFGGGEG